MDLYTAIVRFPTPPGCDFDNLEEVDTTARTLSEAREKIEKILNEQYEPGWEIEKFFVQLNTVTGW